MTEHQHLWGNQRVEGRTIRGQAQCCICNLVKLSRPPTAFPVPNMRKQIELAMIHPMNRGRVIQPTDFAEVCQQCGETAYYMTKRSRGGAECTLFHYLCTACGHKDVEPLD
jgi:hypothetical protein